MFWSLKSLTINHTTKKLLPFINNSKEKEEIKPTATTSSKRGVQVFFVYPLYFDLCSFYFVINIILVNPFYAFLATLGLLCIFYGFVCGSLGSWCFSWWLHVVWLKKHAPLHFHHHNSLCLCTFCHVPSIFMSSSHV